MSKEHVHHPMSQLLQHKLKQFTSARIAIGRSGASLPTKALLKFQLEHAQARDAVHLPFEPTQIKEKLSQGLSKDWSELFESTLLLKSQAENRDTYLQRPDLGRVLNDASCRLVEECKGHYDLAICIVDGLSALAIEKNVYPFVTELLTHLKSDDLALAPLAFIEQGRVAVGDHVAQLLGAKMVLVLIGERPGLLSPDSLGAYLTYHPKLGSHDAQRNCISNIRQGGLSYLEAAKKAHYLISESNRLGFSGVDLKERAVMDPLESPNDRNFLV